MAGTASSATGFFLVEEPGPWGRTALIQSRLDPSIGASVLEATRDIGWRPLLIRRPERQRGAAGHGMRRWFSVWAEPGLEAVRTGLVADDRELARAIGDPTAGEPSDTALFLVCTHGRHDACCALRGRAVAASLAENWPAQTWECSHLGGERFAPNLLLLPHGLTYGRIDPATAPAVIGAYLRAEVVPDLLRGRSIFSSVEQAAQMHARRALGLVQIDALPLVSCTALEERRWQVVFAGPDGGVEVVVFATAAGPPVALTCGAATLERPPAYPLVSLRRLELPSDPSSGRS